MSKSLDFNKKKESSEVTSLFAEKFSKEKNANLYIKKKKSSFLDISGKAKSLPKSKSIPNLTRRHKNKYLSFTKRIIFSIYSFIRKMFFIIVNPILKKLYHERSILIFINDDKHALRYPISNITVILFFLIILSIGYTGYDVYIKQKEDIAFYNSLSEEGKNLYSTAEEYKESIYEFEKQLVEYGEKIEDISYNIIYSSDDENAVESNDINELLSKYDASRKIVEGFLYLPDRIKKIIPVGNWPVAGGGRISSGYGPRISPFTRRQVSYHYGMDIAGAYASPILAVSDGVVTFSDWRGGYGWLVVINHPHGYQTLYGHNSKLIARVGQRVDRGEIIAEMGNTGRTTGIHSHFEVRVDGKSVSPNDYIYTRF